MQPVDACLSALKKTRAGGSRKGSYLPPTAEELLPFETGVRNVFLHGALKRDLDGFELGALEGISGVILLQETKSRFRGGGAYLIRTSGASQVIIQAPHTFFDTGTLELSCHLFVQSQARALFINTTHRYKSAPYSGSDEHPADVAHAAQSFFHSATRAALKANAARVVVQLHGFSSIDDDTSAVISAGQKNHDTNLIGEIAHALEPIIGPKVKRYPEDTRKLGATTNVQGKLVRSAGASFVHLELSQLTRQRLLEDETVRSRFMTTLSDALNQKR